MNYLQELRRLVGSRPLITVGAGILMIDAESQMLLQLRTDNRLWGVPGGGLEPGETLEQTARREVFEETGLRAGRFDFFDVYSGPELCYTYPNGDQIINVSAVFPGVDRRTDSATRRIRGAPILSCEPGAESIEPSERPDYSRLLGTRHLWRVMPGEIRQFL